MTQNSWKTMSYINDFKNGTRYVFCCWKGGYFLENEIGTPHKPILIRNAAISVSATLNKYFLL